LLLLIFISGFGPPAESIASPPQNKNKLIFSILKLPSTDYQLHILEEQYFFFAEIFPSYLLEFHDCDWKPK
jgi:hypothetical protein